MRKVGSWKVLWFFYVYVYERETDCVFLPTSSHLDCDTKAGALAPIGSWSWRCPCIWRPCTEDAIPLNRASDDIMELLNQPWTSISGLNLVENEINFPLV